MFKFFVQIIAFLFPRRIKNCILNILGHDIDSSAKLGFFLARSGTKLVAKRGAKIGHFNYFSCDEVYVDSFSNIGIGNVFKGHFSVHLSQSSSVGNFNKFINGGESLVQDMSKFSIDRNSNITSSHYLDMTGSIKIGQNTVVGGRESQFWTHGFQHFNNGKERCRIDGDIIIEDGVYLGSRVTINPSVHISTGVSLGAGAVVSGNLDEKCLYVSQPLRKIPVSEYSFRHRYKRVDLKGRKNHAYVKKFKL